jgi:hypothetical protein
MTALLRIFRRLVLRSGRGIFLHRCAAACAAFGGGGLVASGYGNAGADCGEKDDGKEGEFGIHGDIQWVILVFKLAFIGVREVQLHPLANPSGFFEISEPPSHRRRTGVRIADEEEGSETEGEKGASMSRANRP